MKLTGNVVADTICRTAELGLSITGAADAGDFTVIEAVAVASINSCPSCSNPGMLRDHVIRQLVDLPIVGFPTKLRVRIPRYRCTSLSCRQKYFRAGLSCAADGSKVTYRVTRWILQRLAIDRMSVAATAKALGLGWDLTCALALDMCREMIYNDPDHLAGVKIIGVDEHKWSHNRKRHGDGFVTVIVDMTDHASTPGNPSPARLLDVIPGRSASALKTWLEARTPEFRGGITIITMDGFTGYASAAQQTIPQAKKVMDPFHMVRLAGDKLTTCRQRLQRQTHGRRGRRHDPLYKNRKTLLTRDTFLTDTQKDRLDYLFDYDQDYAELYECWVIYQRIIDCYEQDNKTRGKTMMTSLIDTLEHFGKIGIEELRQLGNTMTKRKKDILAYFDAHISNGPVEAINGRLEHLRGIALGFRNLHHYILRCLIHSGQLQHKINAL